MDDDCGNNVAWQFSLGASVRSGHNKFPLVDFHNRNSVARECLILWPGRAGSIQRSNLSNNLNRNAT